MTPAPPAANSCPEIWKLQATRSRWPPHQSLKFEKARSTGLRQGCLDLLGIQAFQFINTGGNVLTVHSHWDAGCSTWIFIVVIFIWFFTFCWTGPALDMLGTPTWDQFQFLGPMRFAERRAKSGHGMPQVFPHSSYITLKYYVCRTKNNKSFLILNYMCLPFPFSTQRKGEHDTILYMT